MKKWLYSKLLIFLCIIALVSGCTGPNPSAPSAPTSSPTPTPQHEVPSVEKNTPSASASDSTVSVSPPTPAEPPETKKHFRLAAVGDIMVHDLQLSGAYNAQTGKYDFSNYFTAIQKYIESAHLSLANLETTMAGKSQEYTGYPRFNAPEILAQELKTAGFDIVSTANNHSLDRGYNGLVSTLQHLDAAGLMHMGTYTRAEDRQKILLLEENGIRAAFFSYTYGTNGVKLPAGKEYAVNLIDRKHMLDNIRSAKQQGADLIIFYVHFGIEYKSYPNQQQKDLTRFLFENGVDMVLGSHPHVLQPIEIQTVTVDGKEKKCCVAYSLGNFISKRRELDRASSIILQAEWVKDTATGNTTLEKVSYLPTFVDRSQMKSGKYDYRVVAVEDALYHYQQGKDSLLTADDAQSLQSSWKHTVGLLGSRLLQHTDK